MNPNWSGLTNDELGRREHAGKAGRRGAEGESEQLGGHGVDAVAGGRQLVLADRLPRPPEARVLESIDAGSATTVMMTAIVT